MPLPHLARAPTNPSNPQVVGFCDRCGFEWPLRDLQFQWDYRGLALANLQIRVCPPCYDVPFVFNRPIVLGPDPLPVKDPRPGFMTSEENTPSTYVYPDLPPLNEIND